MNIVLPSDPPAVAVQLPAAMQIVPVVFNVTYTPPTAPDFAAGDFSSEDFDT